MCTSRPPLENVARILATLSDAMIEKPLVFAAIWIVQVTDPGRLSTADRKRSSGLHELPELERAKKEARKHICDNGTPNLKREALPATVKAIP